MKVQFQLLAYYNFIINNCSKEYLIKYVLAPECQFQLKVEAKMGFFYLYLSPFGNGGISYISYISYIYIIIIIIIIMIIIIIIIIKECSISKNHCCPLNH